MKKYVVMSSMLIGLLLLFGGCTASAPIQKDENACDTDNDCVRTGCSGTICQSKNAESVFTTCEYQPEYACYAELPCDCLEHQCQWKNTGEFEQCILEKQGQPNVDEKGVLIV